MVRPFKIGLLEYNFDLSFHLPHSSTYPGKFTTDWSPWAIVRLLSENGVQKRTKRNKERVRVSFVLLGFVVWGCTACRLKMGYEPDELPGCSTPHFHYSGRARLRQIDPNVLKIFNSGLRRGRTSTTRCMRYRQTARLCWNSSAHSPFRCWFARG